MNQQGCITSIIHYQLWSLIFSPSQCIPSAFPVFIQGLSLPCKDWCSICNTCSCCVILGGKNVARSPSKILSVKNFFFFFFFLYLTDAPNDCKVSINTAVWMVICNDPVILTPFKGC